MNLPDQALLSIRRYPNRRLYDVTRSKPVTMEELHRLILEGRRIEVTDTASGEDITAKVLAQMIIDLDSTKLAAFPVALLHRVLQSNEAIMREFLEAHFHEALELFVQAREQFEQQFRKSMGVAESLAAPFEWGRAWWGGLGPVPASGTVPDGGAGLEEAVADLRRQVDELRRQVAAGTVAVSPASP